MSIMTNFEARSYDAWYATPYGSYADALEKKLVFELLGDVQGKLILDAGCGTGNYSKALAERGAQVVGIDVSAEMLREAKSKSVAGISFVHGSAEALPLKSNAFDAVISVMALCFIGDARKAAGEMRRVAKLRGRVVVGVINKWSPYAVWKKIKSRFRGSIYSKARFYNFLELTEILNAAEWRATLFAPPVSSVLLLRILSRIEHPLAVLFKPFGAFIAAQVEK